MDVLDQPVLCATYPTATETTGINVVPNTVVKGWDNLTFV